MTVDPVPSYLPAPPLLELEFDEKFHDDDGNVLEIETRGERDHDKIFFRVQDVMTAFDMPNLDKSLLHVNTNYKRGVHFETFIRVENFYPNKSKTSNKKPKPSLFLTYVGMLKVLFSSSNKHAEKFTNWASEKLFALHLGTIKAKEELIGDIQTNIDDHISVFRSHPCGFPCIYLLSLGKVKDLRATYSIPDTVDDELVVHKFGCSQHFHQRLTEHKRDYGKELNVAINVVAYHMIDPKYKKIAESYISSMFKAYGMILNIPDRKELVALDNEQLVQVKKDYGRTGREYAGATQEMQQKIQELEKDKLILVYEKKELETEIKTMKRIHELELQLKYQDQVKTPIQ